MVKLRRITESKIPDNAKSIIESCLNQLKEELLPDSSLIFVEYDDGYSISLEEDGIRYTLYGISFKSYKDPSKNKIILPDGSKILITDKDIKNNILSYFRKKICGISRHSEKLKKKWNIKKGY